MEPFTAQDGTVYELETSRKSANGYLNSSSVLLDQLARAQLALDHAAAAAVHVVFVARRSAPWHARESDDAASRPAAPLGLSSVVRAAANLLATSATPERLRIHALAGHGLLVEAAAAGCVQRLAEAAGVGRGRALAVARALRLHNGSTAAMRARLSRTGRGWLDRALPRKGRARASPASVLDA